MSNNMIKGYSISFDTKAFKKLDFTDRENELLGAAKQKYFEQNGHMPDEPQASEGFTLGISAETIDENLFPSDDGQAISSESFESIKAQLTEEIRAQVRAELEDEVRAELKEASDEILSNAMNQAESIKSRALDEGRLEGEAAKTGIIALASSQGYEDGIKRAKDEYAEAKAALEAEKIQLENNYSRQVAEMEPAFVEILKDYVRKITGISYENHKEILEYLIECGIARAPKETDFQVHLCPADYERFSTEFDKLSNKYEGKLTLNYVSDRSLNPGDVHLENNGRILDCSLGVNMEGLLDALDMLSI